MKTNENATRLRVRCRHGTGAVRSYRDVAKTNEKLPGRYETLQNPLQNHLGEPKWYEMVRKPMKMQRGCGCGAATVRVRCGRTD